MTDEAKAVAEIAKTTGKAIDSASKFGGFMARFITRPLEQLSGIAEDQFKFMRWERQARLMDRADAVLQARGMTAATRPVPLNIAVPILQAGSLEENNELQDVWANMLVNAADESVDVQFRRAFISIAEDLTYLDKQMLECIYSAFQSDDKGLAISVHGLPGQLLILGSTVDEEIEASSIDLQAEVSLGNLARLGMVQFGQHMGDNFGQYRCIHRTSLGIEFMKAIQ
jgi:hypothetical protein